MALGVARGMGHPSTRHSRVSTYHLLCLSVLWDLPIRTFLLGQIKGDISCIESKGVTFLVFSERITGSSLRRKGFIPFPPSL